ncbi:hypothetical protein [Neptuniibacter sp. QD37_11]|uniref:hypothetical protein n=1 Tax=Neptuniibacter sp. QD37_11 TaxID=3398209 RepID=UPI0039F5A060
MGVGNYSLSEGNAVYIDYDAVYGDFDSDEGKYSCEEFEGDHDARNWAYEDLLGDLKGMMLSSYDKCDTSQGNARSNSDGDGVVIGESRLFEISVVEWEGYFAVCIGIHPDLEEGTREHTLAENSLGKTTDAYFTNLSKVYGDNLRERSCAWTSHVYEPPVAKRKEVEDPSRSM